MLYGILKSNTNTGLDSEILIPFAAPLSVISNDPSFASDGMNLRRVVVNQGVQRWEIETNLKPSSTSPEFLYHSVKNKHATTFYVRMPQPYTTSAWRSTGSPVLSGDIVAGANSGNYSGGLVKEGEFFQFGSESKVRLITNVNGSSFTFEPKAQTTISTGASMKFGGLVTMRAKYDLSTSLGMTYTDGILSNPGTIRLIEALE